MVQPLVVFCLFSVVGKSLGKSNRRSIETPVELTIVSLLCMRKVELFAKETITNSRKGAEE